MHIVRTFVLHEIYIFFLIIINDFGNSVKGTAGYIEVAYYFRNIKYVGLNENCFIGYLVV